MNHLVIPILVADVLMLAASLAIFLALPPRQVVRLLNLWGRVRTRNQESNDECRTLWHFLSALRGPDSKGTTFLKETTTAYIRWPLRFLCMGWANVADPRTGKNLYGVPHASMTAGRGAVADATVNENTVHFAWHARDAAQALVRMGFEEYEELIPPHFR